VVIKAIQIKFSRQNKKNLKCSGYNRFYDPISNENNRIQICALVARNFEGPVLKENLQYCYQKNFGSQS